MRLVTYVGLSLVTRGLSLLIDVIDKDEAAHIVGAWQLLDGGLLYTDFVDNKPPLLYVYYALAQLLFGRGLDSVHLLTLLVTVPLTAFAASAFFAHDRRGHLAGLMLIVYSAAFLGHDMLAAHGELLALLPTAWALAQMRDPDRTRRLLRMGVCGGLIGVAALLKPTSSLYLVGFALVAAQTLADDLRRAAAALASLAVGFAAPLVLTYAIFRTAGGAEGLLHWTLIHNLGYAANPIPWNEALGRAVSSLLPFLLVTAWLWWGWARSAREFPSRHAARLVSATLLLSLPPVFLGLRFFPHYFVPLYLPLALAAAPKAAELLTPPFRRVARIAVAYTLLMLIGFSASTVWLYFFRTDVYEETRPVFERMAVRLRDDACYEGASLFVWGFAPQLYYSLELAPASRFVVPQASLTGYVPGNLASVSTEVSTQHLISSRAWDWLMADLTQTPPTYILDTSTSGLHRWHHYPLAQFPRLHGLVREQYEWLGGVDRVGIYRHRGCFASSHAGGQVSE